MKILRFDDPAFARQIAQLDRRHEPDPGVRERVTEILAAVRAQGDFAVLSLTEKFGGPAFAEAAAMRVTEADPVGVEVRTSEALRLAHANVLAFAQRSRREDWAMTNVEGAYVAERFRPFERVGIYVPGGTAPLVSTALMTCTLAQAAGCPEIVVTTPAGREGGIAPALRFALRLAGATEIYKIGGAQAIGALAFGTETIRPVLKIFGPGNAYVVEAKRQVFGRVSIDLLPGPSEVMVLGDENARADWIAADLLAQAEHGADSAMIFITPSAALLGRVTDEVLRQAALLPRQAQLGPVLENHAVGILTRDLAQAVEIANGYAPEHLALHVAEAESVSEQVTTSGAIFLGGFSPVAAGDFLAGPSHTLPTGGAGKSFGGLTVDQFQRRTSLVRYDADSLAHATPIIEEFARIEGLEAHGRSARMRLG